MSRGKKIVWGLIVIAFFVLLYLFSIGYFDAKKVNLANEFQETKKSAKQKNRKLKVKLKAVKDYEIFLKTRYRRWKILFRTFLVLIWLAFATPLYFLDLIVSLTGLFTYLGVTSTIYFISIFVLATDKNHLFELVKIFEIRLQNWIYGNYITIEDDVLVLKNEIKNNNQQMIN